MALRGARVAVSNGRRLLHSAPRMGSTLRFGDPAQFRLGGSMEVRPSVGRDPIVLRRLSSTAAVASKKNSSSSKDDSNIFLDNLGKIFMTTIGMGILAIVRSSKGRTNRINVRTELEDDAALDPLEIDDLRVANSELTQEVYETIAKNVQQTFPHGTATYADFVKTVRRTMIGLKGEAFTVELGHLMDRAVFAAVKERGSSLEEELPLAFHLTALSLALNSSVPERMRTLYKVLQQTSDDGDTVRLHHVVDMVGYLQDTCQLIPDAQVVESDTKYPIQTYKKGSAKELVEWDGSENDEMDLEAFASVLCTRSVCAWGECHNRTLKVAT